MVKTTNFFQKVESFPKSLHPTIQYRIWVIVGYVLQVRIFGGPAIYVKEGSSVQLECVVSQAVNTPKYIVWEHNGQGQENNIALKTLFIYIF